MVDYALQEENSRGACHVQSRILSLSVEEQHKDAGVVAESRRRILLAVSRVDPKTRDV